MLKVAEEFVMPPAIRFQLRSKAIVPCPAESRFNPESRYHRTKCAPRDQAIPPTLIVDYPSCRQRRLGAFLRHPPCLEHQNIPQ